MKVSDRRKFGRTNLEVTTFAFGTAPIGNIFKPMDEQVSDGMIQSASDAGIRYYDTAPMYGHGLSELRSGHSLRWKEREARLKAALEAIDAGTYGICVDCGEEISEGRLRALPDAVRCVPCQRVASRRV